MWYPAWDPETENELGTGHGNVENIWAFVNNNVSVLVHQLEPMYHANVRC